MKNKPPHKNIRWDCLLELNIELTLNKYKSILNKLKNNNYKLNGIDIVLILE